jgi:hypothetical protein
LYLQGGIPSKINPSLPLLSLLFPN